MKNENKSLGKQILKRPNGSTKVVTAFDPDLEPSKTQQQFKDEVDVNQVMSRYMKTGQWPVVPGSTGVYADLSALSDYQSMLDQVRHADESFNALPSYIRARFGNSPEALIHFLQDPANVEESYRLNLRQRPPAPNEPNEPTPDIAQKTSKKKDTDIA